MNQPEINQPEEITPEFEQQLLQAFRPVAPPEGFAGRTLARLSVEAPAPVKVLRMPPRSRVWASGAIAAALLVAAFVTQQTHIRHQQREKAELAQQQFEAGIRITDNTLEHVRQQLQQAGVQVGN